MKIILSVASALLFIGCGGSTSETTAPSNESKNIATVIEKNTTVPLQKMPSAQASNSTASSVSEEKTEIASVDGKAIFTQKCVSCHGVKAEKSALNKSQIIANFSEAQIKDALKGYQAGTYGKEMKGIMQGQVKTFDDTQIEALAHYISTL